MQGRLSRIVIAVFFAGLLAAPLIYKRVAVRYKQSLTADPSGVFARYGFRFEESAKASGIGFRHTSPKLDGKLDHIMPQVASMGAAVSIVDFDRDGLAD